MERETSIFYKMTRENENSTTELLCNLFRIKYFRDICLEYFGIEKNIIDEISLENISSQNSTDDSGKPDIVIDTDNFKCYIENKIQKGTDLQENQKSNYPENLLKFKETQGKKIRYVFLIPKEYQHEKDIDEIVNNYNGFTQKYYWNEFLSYLKKKELNIESPVIREGLNYFSELVQTDEQDELDLNPREVVIMYNPRTIKDVLSFVEKIKGTVKDSLEMVEKRMKSFSLGGEQNDQWGQGYGLIYNGKEVAWVGISPALYEKENGLFVYSVALATKHLKENIKIDNNEFRNYSHDGYLFIAIDKDLFVEDDKVKILANEIIKILKNVFIKNYIEK